MNAISLDESTEKAMDTLSQLSGLELALFKASADDDLNERLESSELAPLWFNRFNKLRLPNFPAAKFRDPNPQTHADFYCGYVLFSHAQRVTPSNPDYMRYLRLAAFKFGCYYALEVILTDCIRAINQPGLTHDVQKKLISHCQGVLFQSTHHMNALKTPGCLLLSTVYLALTDASQRLALFEEQRWCVYLSRMYFHLAHLQRGQSKAQIYNAYFNQGLSVSNPFGADNFEQIECNYFYALMSGPLDPAIMQQADHAAEVILNSSSAPICLPIGMGP